MFHLEDEHRQVVSLARHLMRLPFRCVNRNMTVKYFPLGEDKSEELKNTVKASETIYLSGIFYYSEATDVDTVLDIF